MVMASSRQELSVLSKDELISLVQKFQGGTAATIEESSSSAPRDSAADDAPPQKKKQRKERAFDMSRHAQRHVALKIAYIGTAYQGFAYQQNLDPTSTVEGQLLQAAIKTCLITDRASCGIVCGGRTDKGVSGLGQVVSLRVRSNFKSGDGIVGWVPPAASTAAAAASAAAPGGEMSAGATKKAGGGSAPAESAPQPSSAQAGKEEAGKAAAKPQAERPEMDYAKVLNACLPDDIRVLAWHPVDDSFSARFSASHRTYKYFFPRADLNVAVMQQAAQRLLGEHDFRNFCKIDPVRALHSTDERLQPHASSHTLPEQRCSLQPPLTASVASAPLLPLRTHPPPIVLRCPLHAGCDQLRETDPRI